MKARHEFPDDEHYRDYLRHYYAGQAMQGLLSNPDYNCPSRPKDIVTTTGTAMAAIHYADALLKELSK